MPSLPQATHPSAAVAHRGRHVASSQRRAAVPWRFWRLLRVAPAEERLPFSPLSERDGSRRITQLPYGLRFRDAEETVLLTALGGRLLGRISCSEADRRRPVRSLGRAGSSFTELADRGLAAYGRLPFGARARSSTSCSNGSSASRSDVAGAAPSPSSRRHRVF